MAAPLLAEGQWSLEAPRGRFGASSGYLTDEVLAEPIYNPISPVSCAGAAGARLCQVPVQMVLDRRRWSWQRMLSFHWKISFFFSVQYNITKQKCLTNTPIFESNLETLWRHLS